eukprot:6754099-Prymnesium_polylepis.2
MPTWRISQSLPALVGAFDLVILDEASQSDTTALPALLRGIIATATRTAAFRTAVSPTAVSPTAASPTATSLTATSLTAASNSSASCTVALCIAAQCTAWACAVRGLPRLQAPTERACRAPLSRPGKQVLIVGDGKQVSPSCAFVSEARISSLKASLLSRHPYVEQLLPGRRATPRDLV